MRVPHQPDCEHGHIHIQHVAYEADIPEAKGCVRKAGGPVDTQGYPRVEEAVRLLAAATAAARLYPASSSLPREAAERFSERANELAAAGPLRVNVEPHGFHVGGTLLAGQSQAAPFAEALHAMQVGQLIIAHGVSVAETLAFVSIANSDPVLIRREGGARAALASAGVAHVAVIEVSLRASDEEGILGLDLTSAPLEEIAAEVVSSVERRAREAMNGPASDEVAEAISRMEDATRTLAQERIAEAMLRLDETSRMRVLGLSLKADTQGSRMDGMLKVIARMRPAALARLLRLVATQANADPRRIAAAFELPPETAKALSLILQQNPSFEPDFGIPPEEQARELARVLSVEEDSHDLDRQIAVAAPALSAGRALATTTAISRRSPTEATVQAIAEVLPQAARDGSFMMVREALRRLDEIAAEPALSQAVAAARSALADPAVLADVCRATVTDADAAIAGEILTAAGPSGADALLDAYVRLPQPKRALLRPVLRGLSEGVLGAARLHIRSSDARLAVAVLRTLPELGDSRAVPVIADALDSLDEQVRFAAVTALASMRVPEASSALARALNHREPETQRHAVREIARIRLQEAVPMLARALEDLNVLQRTYETRKEIIGALESIGTPEAEKALRRFAQRTVGLGRKTRELRNRAVRVADELAGNRGVRPQ